MIFFSFLILLFSISFSNVAFSHVKKGMTAAEVNLEYPDTDFFSVSFRENLLPKDEYSGKDGMNDIDFKEYLTNFDRLKLVTIRYREDNNEIRMVYGNDLAIEGLKENFQYKTGAMFYKIAYPTISDPIFISSKIPGHGYVRYQFMKYNPEKYASGWGYAIFDYYGKTFAGKPSATMETCVACHDLAKKRNNVFSTMMENPNPEKMVKKDQAIFKSLFIHEKPSNYIPGEKIRFINAKTSEIPDEVKVFIRQKSSSINKLTGDILSKDFIAYLPEIVPLLIKETLKNRLPSYGFVKKNRSNFVLSYIAPPDKKCSVKKINVYYGVGFYHEGGTTSYRLNKNCFSPDAVFIQ
jgi:hypothetical protein